MPGFLRKWQAFSTKIADTGESPLGLGKPIYCITHTVRKVSTEQYSQLFEYLRPTKLNVFFIFLSICSERDIRTLPLIADSSPGTEAAQQSAEARLIREPLKNIVQ
jgi:hypothetical protein